MDKQPMRPGQYANMEALAASSVAEVEEKLAGPGEPPSESNTAPDADVKDPTASLTPAERWANNLKAAQITEAQALAILDAMLDKGYYQREYKLFRGRLSITLRTRESSSTHRVSEAIDRLRNPLDMVVRQTAFRLNLAGSLVKYASANKQPLMLPHLPANSSYEDLEKAFGERVRFVDGLQETIQAQMFQCLAHFDTIVGAALSEGASENF